MDEPLTDQQLREAVVEAVGDGDREDALHYAHRWQHRDQGSTLTRAMHDETVTLSVADVAALVLLAWELTHHIAETDTSATGSIYGIEFAHKTIAKVAVRLPTKPAK